MTGYFGGWNTGNMAADQKAAALFANGSTKKLEVLLTDTGAGIWTTQQFRLNTAHAKILTLLLAFNRPLDLLTGQKIDISKALHYTNTKEYHHFFPKDFLVSRGTDVRKANLLSNFIMLTSASNRKISNRAPSDYLKDVESSLGDKIDLALAANLISKTAYAAAKADDYDTFLKERAKTIYERSKELTDW